VKYNKIKFLQTSKWCTVQVQTGNMLPYYYMYNIIEIEKRKYCFREKNLYSISFSYADGVV